MVYGAGGIGAILALIVGVRSLLDGHRGEIAIIAPPPVRCGEKTAGPWRYARSERDPADLGAAGTAGPIWRPGPEQPKLAALAARYAASQPDPTDAADTLRLRRLHPRLRRRTSRRTHRRRRRQSWPSQNGAKNGAAADRAVQAVPPAPTDASASLPVRKAVLFRITARQFVLYPARRFQSGG